MASHGEPISLWWDEVGGGRQARAALGEDLDVDVAIVGGGFTGLWTARSLLERDPSLRVALVEAQTCGFGASGRNGGWASALFSVSDARIARDHGLDQARAMRRAMQASVDEIARATAEDGIDCELDKGGTVVLARNEAQLARARSEVEEARRLGFGDEDLRLLDAGEAAAMVGADRVLGGTFTPHCAAIQPARLALGLAEAAERRGVAVFEGSPATELRPGGPGRRPQVVTPGGTITADVVVRGTEAWSSQLAASQRSVVPVYSLMIATEPLDAETLSAVGLARRQTFSDERNLIVYGQRTRSGRIAFGGRGAWYHYGSAISPAFDRSDRVFDDLREALVELIPALAGARITHRWGGPLGIARDWHSSVGLDRATGMAWAGGYVGDGVTTTNLAGRTLADLVVGIDSELTALPWVNHRSRRWEPEPLRWIGVNAGLIATRLADRSEARSGRPSKVAGVMSRLLGG